nr:hypothetical protein [Methanosarcina mazei]
MTDKRLSLKSFVSPTGIAKQTPCYNVTSRRRRRFLNRWIRSLATEAGRVKIRAELRRRIRHNKYWVNEANKYGIETLCELMLAILDDLDLRDWQRTTAAWRLQIGVWQNMSFQSNHPE